MAESAATTVVSWNTGQRFRWGMPRSTPDGAIGDIATRVAAWSPDVVCLQELRSPAQLAVLCARLGPPWHGQLTAMPGSDRQIALVTRHEGDGVLFEEVSTSTGRNGLRLTLPPREPGAGVTHIIGCHGSAFSAAGRRTYFNELIDSCEGLPGDDSVLLVGDFNIDPWLAWLTIDRQVLARLRSAWERLFRRRRATFLGLLQLDHAYLRERGAVPARADVIPGTRAYRRDHDPIWVRLAPPPPTPPAPPVEARVDAPARPKLSSPEPAVGD